jgi:pimeloyl-ACP methyl ester carboxylesterase
MDMTWPEKWVLLRGLGRESRHWFEFPERFAEQAGVECVTLDLPGAGDQAEVPTPLSIPKIARDVARRYAAAAGADPREFGVLGLSLGGMVALSWASEHPTAIAALVLVNSSSTLSPPFERIRPGGLAQLLHAAIEPDAMARESSIYQLTLNADRARVEREAARSAAIVRSAPMTRRTVVRQLLAAARFAPPKLKTPTLVLSSARDVLVKPVCSERLAAYLGCPHVRHPTGGHDLALEDPDWVIARVWEWTQTLPPVADFEPVPSSTERARHSPDQTGTA